MDVGSCINTLVSSTKTRRPSRGRARGSARSAGAAAGAGIGVADETGTDPDSGAGARDCAPAGPGSERLRCFKHFLRVPRDFHLTPFLPQHPLGVDQESAALDAEILPAVQALLPDDIEQFANLFFLVRQQGEGQR